MGDVNWSETKAILLELEQLFKRDDDVNDIDDIKKMSKEIDLIYENNLKSTKELIKDMTARVAEKEKDIIGTDPLVHALVTMTNSFTHSLPLNHSITYLLTNYLITHSLLLTYSSLQRHQKLCTHLTWRISLVKKRILMVKLKNYINKWIVSEKILRH